MENTIFDEVGFFIYLKKHPIKLDKKAYRCKTMKEFLDRMSLSDVEIDGKEFYSKKSIGAKLQSRSSKGKFVNQIV